MNLKSIERARPISRIVNTAVKQALTENAQDLAGIEQRAAEPLVSFPLMLKWLKKDGRI